MKTSELKQWGYHFVRLFLGIMWLYTSLEKFFPAFRGFGGKFLQSGTGNVVALTEYMTQITPYPWVATLLGWLVPLGPVLQYAVAATELFFAISLLSNRWTKYSTILAIGMLILFHLGWIAVEWPFVYVTIMALHVVIFLRALHGDKKDVGAVLLRILYGIMWIYVGGTDHLLTVAIGVLLIIGFLTPVASIYGIFLMVQSLLAGDYGVWPWVYHAIIVGHLYLLVPGLTSSFSLDRWVPWFGKRVQ
jgi:uncharacterized membrane protein YphA (DoxX/SURF4 family)